jgi:hypothetical protein
MQLKPESKLLPLEGIICWVMLNPSTADAETDDPTLNKIMKFSVAWGYKKLVVVNLFDLRATMPDALLSTPLPASSRNKSVIQTAIGAAEMVVAAWGSHAAVREDAIKQAFGVSFLDQLPPMKCLGITKSGEPRHPLYIADITKPVDYERPQPQAV